MGLWRGQREVTCMHEVVTPLLLCLVFLLRGHEQVEREHGGIVTDNWASLACLVLAGNALATALLKIPGVLFTRPRIRGVICWKLR